METYTTTAADGRTLELEIVQAAPYGFAVNFHQMDECVGKLYFDGEGYRTTAGELEINLQDGEKALGTFADKWEAIAAIVANLSAYLDAHDEPPHDPADAAELVMDELDAEVYGDHYSYAAIRDICRRAAYDLGIKDRRAHDEMLPTIARRAADLIRDEMGPTLLEQVRQDLADELGTAGWTATDHTRTAYQSPDRRSIAINFGRGSISVYLEDDEQFTVRTAGATGARLARIITAYYTR
ncbi:hypothetical protein SEA_REDFOX_27 [Arthrobacter phage RedFox]|nr:hypothetical protein SEA_REDFOX_27 [Arthrobacter phage RedFox]